MKYGIKCPECQAWLAYADESHVCKSSPASTCSPSCGYTDGGEQVGSDALFAIGISMSLVTLCRKHAEPIWNSGRPHTSVPTTKGECCKCKANSQDRESTQEVLRIDLF